MATNTTTIRREVGANRRDNAIARELGVTRVGLEVLARMVAGNGVGRTRGMAGYKLIAQGFVKPGAVVEGRYIKAEITDAGREIVRRARALGW